MEAILIEGGRPLNGHIFISGAKNSALPILAASLLTSQKVFIHNIPYVSDVKTMIDLLRTHGAKVDYNEKEKSVSVLADNITNLTASYEIVSKMRASIWVLGPLLTRFGYAKVSLPGGCKIGTRQIDLHLEVLTYLGAHIEYTKDGYIVATSSKKLQGCYFNFNKISVGATINGIIASILAEGISYLTNCAQEPEVSDLCMYLNILGSKIEGIGTSNLKITGVETLNKNNNVHYKIISDRIEAGTYIAAAGITKGYLSLFNIDYNLIENLCFYFRKAGIHIKYIDNTLFIDATETSLKPVNINTYPYPGFATDLQAQFIALMTLANGSSIITENVFDNRFMHITELCRMGANIIVKDSQAIVNGVKELSGAEVKASDLRASAALVLAGLAAKGQTKIFNIHHLDRGYEKLEFKLQACNGIISRIKL